MSNFDKFIPFIIPRIGKGKTFITEYKLEQYKKFIDGNFSCTMNELSMFKQQIQDFIDEFTAEFTEQLSSIQVEDFVKCIITAYNKKYDKHISFSNNKSIEITDCVGTKSFEALKNDLFGNNLLKQNNIPLLYYTIPEKVLDGYSVYAIRVLIPLKGVYPGFPTLYCVTDNIKKNRNLIRKTYVDYIKTRYKSEVKKYTNTYGISISHDISLTKVKNK